MSKQPTATPPRRTQGGTREVSRRTGSDRRRAVAKGSAISFEFPLGMPNLIGIMVGVALAIIGYLLMQSAVPEPTPEAIAGNDGLWNSTAAVVIAPILLAIGYCIVVPIAIMYRRRREGENAPVAATEE